MRTESQTSKLRAALNRRAWHSRVTGRCLQVQSLTLVCNFDSFAVMSGQSCCMVRSTLPLKAKTMNNVEHTEGSSKYLALQRKQMKRF